MTDLKQIQPLTDPERGYLMGLIGLDSRGNVYYGSVRPGRDDQHIIVWKLMQEE